MLIDDAAGRCWRRGPATRCRGRWRAATRGRSGARQRAVRVDPAAACCSWCRSSTAAARCAGATSTCSCSCSFVGLAGLLQPREDRRVGAARLPAAALPAGADAARWPRDRGRRRERRRGARLVLPVRWLAVGLVFLVGFRVGAERLDSNVIDVGYAGVIGADRLLDGERLYGDFPSDNDHGDTYGPVVYLAYVPFEQVWPWSGELGRPAGGPRRGDRLRPAHDRAAVAARAGASAGPTWGWRSPTAGRRSRSPCTRQARTPTTRWSPRWWWPRSWRRTARRAGSAGRAGRPDEVRPAGPGAAAGPGRRAAGPGAAGRMARFSLAFAVTAAVVMAPVLADGRPAHVLGPDARLPGRARVAVLDLGPVGGLGAAADRGAGRRRGAGAGGRGGPAPARHGPPVRAGRGGADRRPAGRGALVLPVRRVVLPAGAGGGAGRGPAAGLEDGRNVRPAAGASTCSIESARIGCEQLITTAISQGSSSEVSKRAGIWVTSASSA